MQDVDVDGLKAGERDCGQQEALAKGEPRVNTDKTVTEGADFLEGTLPEYNGYNCFPEFLESLIVFVQAAPVSSSLEKSCSC